MESKITLKNLGEDSEYHKRDSSALQEYPQFKDKEVIYVEWTSGGRSGGSCWDDGKEDRHYEVEGDPEPAFEDLEKLLQEHCPQLTYLQFRKLERELVHTHDYTQREYYGNYYEKRIKFVVLEEFHKFIEELRASQ